MLKEKKMNQKPYNKCLINLDCSVCTDVPDSICLLFLLHVQTPQANTFPYSDLALGS